MLRNLNFSQQLINLLILALIVVLSMLAFTANYWLGIIILFFGLLILIVLRFRTSEYLELLLIMHSLLFVAVLAGSLAQGWLIGEQQGSSTAAPGPLAEALSTNYLDTVVLSVLIGVGVALLLAGILFLLLNLSFVSVTIENGEIKGKERHKQKLATSGGPGRVRIYPEQVVVFHKHGKITRAAGLGATMLRRGEKIKAIIPLGVKAGPQKIENVLTRDRIALTLNVVHGAGIELVSGTKKRLEDTKDKVARDEKALELLKEKVRQASLKDDREAIREQLAHLEAQEPPDKEKIDLLKKYKEALEQLEKDKKTVEQLQKIVDGKQTVSWMAKILSLFRLLEPPKSVNGGQTVGDEHSQCYVDIAKLVAAKAPNAWEATKGGVVGNLRDVFMTNDFEDLFEIEGEAEDLKAKIDKRKIAEFEKFVLGKVKGGKLGDGIVLGFVDIGEVYYPDEIAKKLKEEAAALVEARTKVLVAKSDEEAATYESKAKVIRARSEAEAKVIEGRGEGEARAAFFHELLQELKQEELQGEELVEAIVELIGRMVSVSDLENLLKETSIPVQRLTSGLIRINGSQR